MRSEDEADTILDTPEGQAMTRLLNSREWPLSLREASAPVSAEMSRRTADLATVAVELSSPHGG